MCLSVFLYICVCMCLSVYVTGALNALAAGILSLDDEAALHCLKAVFYASSQIKFLTIIGRSTLPLTMCRYIRTCSDERHVLGVMTLTLLLWNVESRVQLQQLDLAEALVRVIADNIQVPLPHTYQRTPSTRLLNTSQTHPHNPLSTPSQTIPSTHPLIPLSNPFHFSLSPSHPPPPLLVTLARYGGQPLKPHSNPSHFSLSPSQHPP